MHEAEKNIPAGIEIDQLVEDYKSSLIIHQFEKTVVDNTLDTIISDAELNAYYDENNTNTCRIFFVNHVQFVHGFRPEEIQKAQ